MKWKIAKQILTINIQDDGKTITYQKSEDPRSRGRFPFLHMREYGQTTECQAQAMPLSS